MKETRLHRSDGLHLTELDLVLCYSILFGRVFSRGISCREKIIVQFQILMFTFPVKVMKSDKVCGFEFMNPALISLHLVQYFR